MMVNDLYDLSMIEKNHQNDVGQIKIAVLGTVRRLLRSFSDRQKPLG